MAKGEKHATHASIRKVYVLAYLLVCNNTSRACWRFYVKLAYHLWYLSLVKHVGLEREGE